MSAEFVVVELWADGVRTEDRFRSLAQALRAAREDLASADEILWARVERREDGVIDYSHRIAVTP